MRRVVLTAVCCLAAAVNARGQTVLAFEDVVARARLSAGVVAVARARIAEAEAARAQAQTRFRDNPVISGALGPRFATGDNSLDIDIGVSQQFETGGQRRARLADAEADVDRQRAEADDAARGAVFAAAVAFVNGVAATERLRMAEESDAVARDLVAATERRYAAGDIAAIDLNLARIERARSHATLRSAGADVSAAVGVLRAVLRIPAGEAIELRGVLDVRPAAPLAELRTVLEQRPDLAALRADLRAAEAQMQLGRALRRPDLAFRAGYGREQTNTILLGGLTVTLPTFQNGQGTFALGTARASRARIELDAVRDRALAELDAAYSVYEQQASLTESFVQDVTASVTDNEDLARRSYDAGELNLVDFLVVRRSALDTRAAIIDRRLDTARSRLAIDFIAGVLR